MRRRHRHGPYQYSRPSYGYSRRRSLPSFRPIIGLLIVGALLYVVGSWVLSFFGSFGGAEAGVTLLPEDRGIVRVSLEGGEWKQTDSQIKLYEEDQVQTANNGVARLEHFDGTLARMDENSTLTIGENEEDEDDSRIELQMQTGRVWVRTPTSETYSGSIVRQISTPILTVNMQPGTEALIEDRSVFIFESEGIGNTISFTDSEQTIIVGEGQSFVLPETADLQGDLYRFRKALDPLVATASFIRESRAFAPSSSAQPTDDTTDFESDTLNVTEPEEGDTIAGATVAVSGTYGADVQTIRVNGYEATLDGGSFSIELALPDEEQTTITVEALDEDGVSLAEIIRQVSIETAPAASPNFLEPARAGQTYRTQEEEIEIVGTAPPGTMAILVNDYQLQFFEPGDTDWTYLARVSLGNYQRGTNVFRAVAVNANGDRSEPAELTIILGQGPEGVVAEDNDDDDSTDDTTPETDEEEFPDPSTLPQNDPIAPGSISVTAPTEGAIHSGSESDLLIEGTTGSNTATVWVNDYQLRLYEAGKTFWNYIANEELGTLEPGNNRYEIVTRDASGQILDRFVYTIVYTPAEGAQDE